MVKRVDHIGIAVRHLQESIESWCKAFGLKAGAVERLEGNGVHLAHLHAAEGPSVELVSPIGESSPVSNFLEKRGEGIHHFCFEVEGIEEAMSQLKKQGVSFVQDKPRKGAQDSRIAFIKPSFFNGVLIELKEKK